MKPMKLMGVAGALAVLALSVPAGASAHPGVYTVQAKVAKTAAKQTITIDATAAQVLGAIDDDPAIGDNVTITGNAGGPYSLTFVGALAGVAVAQLAPVSGGLTGGAGTATASVVAAGGANVVYPADPATQADQVQYVVANDGYTAGFKEDNGVTQATEGGQLNYKAMATTYRAPLTSAQKLVFPSAQTDLQVHATCTGVAALQNPVNIDNAEPGNGSDPYYNYIPWQSTSAGMGDSASTWIPVVKSITDGLPGAPAGGVDLTGMSEAQAKTACEGLGGVFHKADTKSAIATALISDAVTPLNTQITSLNGQVTTLTGQVTTLTADKAALQSDKDTLTAENAALQSDKDTLTAEKAALQSAKDALQTAKDASDQAAAEANAAKQTAQEQAAAAQAAKAASLARATAAEAARDALIARPLTVALAAKKFAAGGAVVLVTGPAGATASVSIRVTQKQASALKLSSRVIASGSKKLGAQGAVLITPRAKATVLKALTKLKGTAAVSVDVTAGAKSTSVAGTLVR